MDKKEQKRAEMPQGEKNLQCFWLLSEIKPPNNGKYEVITSKGRVVLASYESFLGNDVWAADYHLHEIGESVLAWRFLK